MERLKIKMILIGLLFSNITNIYSRSSKLDYFREKTKIENPFKLRDPFRVPFGKVPKKVGVERGILRDGVFTNLPSIEGVPLKDIKIVGTVVGNERRALALVRDTATVMIKEGMKLGAEGAEIKAILPGGIVLVEKIINVYGQEEYLETIMPLVREEEVKSAKK